MSPKHSFILSWVVSNTNSVLVTGVRFQKPQPFVRSCFQLFSL